MTEKLVWGDDSDSSWTIVIPISEDLQKNYPSGKIELAVASQGRPAPEVEAVYARFRSLPEGEQVRSRDLDDGMVVVDYNESNEFVGVELLKLTYNTEEEKRQLPEFHELANAHPILRVAANTSWNWWAKFHWQFRWVERLVDELLKQGLDPAQVAQAVKSRLASTVMAMRSRISACPS